MKKSEIVKRLEAIEKRIGIAKEELKLEVGKWYWRHLDNHRKLLFCFNGVIEQRSQYGFDAIGDWSDKLGLDKYSEYSVATPQEVEEALVREAKRRYKVGDKVRSHQGTYTLQTLDCKYGDKFECNGIYSIQGYGVWLFLNGKWSEVIKKSVDKFAELKEAHSNGAVIQVKYPSDKTWKDCDAPRWVIENEYRIKPEEKPKVGDVCLFSKPADENHSSCWEISRLSRFDSPDTQIPYKSSSNLWYREARVLTKQEAIELLFGKGE